MTKYWLFDGNDVVGPLAPRDIVARAGFSDSVLVCPEGESENAASWQTAANFNDFMPSAVSSSSLTEEILVPAQKEPASCETEEVVAPTEENPKSSVPYASVSTELEKQRTFAFSRPISISSIPLTIASVPISHLEKDELILSVANTETSQKSSAVLAKALPLPSVQHQKRTGVTEVKETTTPKTQATVTSAQTTQKTKTATKAIVPVKQEMTKNQLATPAETKKHSSSPAASTVTQGAKVLSSSVKSVTTQSVIPSKSTTPPTTTQSPTTKKENIPLNKKTDVSAASTKTNTLSTAVTTKTATQPLIKNKESAETANQKKEITHTKKTLSTDSKEMGLWPELSLHSLPVLGGTESQLPPIPNGYIPFKETEPAAWNQPEDTDIPPLKSGQPAVSSTSQLVEELATLVQTPQAEPESPFTQMQESTSAAESLPNRSSSRWGTVLLIWTGILLLLLFLLVGTGCWISQANHSSDPTATTTTVTAPKTAAKTTSNNASTRPDIPVPPPPKVVVSPLQEKALSIVKNYVLPGNKGTVEQYFNHLYATQLEQGYQARWDAEPLHKNTYIVKYRLNKTRTEPVVYVFLADTDTGRLTGALNNITLDLVGKI